jgi:hypothetical protein
LTAALESFSKKFTPLSSKIKYHIKVSTLKVHIYAKLGFNCADDQSENFNSNYSCNYALLEERGFSSGEKSGEKTQPALSKCIFFPVKTSKDGAHFEQQRDLFHPRGAKSCKLKQRKAGALEKSLVCFHSPD